MNLVIQKLVFFKNPIYNMKSISFVIPNKNGVNLLKKLIPLLLIRFSQIPIIVIDDASTDKSVEYLQSFAEKIDLIVNKFTKGFSDTVNEGVLKAKTDLVFLLNTDVIPEDNFWEPLVKYFDDDATFAVGCLEKSHEKQCVVDRGRGVAHWERGLFVHSRGEINSTSTAWVSGGSGLFDRTKFNKLGGFCSLYAPFYWEDIDLSYRAVKCGYSIYFEQLSVVHHYHENGSIRTSHSADFVKLIAYRNQFYFCWLNISSLSLLCKHFVWLPYHLARAIVGRDKELLQGYLQALSNMHRVLYFRKQYQQRMKVPDPQQLGNTL